MVTALMEKSHFSWYVDPKQSLGFFSLFSFIFVTLKTQIIYPKNVRAKVKTIWTIWPSLWVNGLDWQCYLAGSSKTAPRIFIFSIAMVAKYLFYVTSISTFALTFFGYIISVLAGVSHTFSIFSLF